MKYSYKKVREQIIKKVKDACYKKKNYFGGKTWELHIQPVVKYSLFLGKKLGADLEVLELSALLHDYANLIDNKKYDKQHHVYGASFARKILKNLLPEEKINHITDSILSHRGSSKIKAKTLEAKIIRSADAMSHITELADMFYLVYGIHGLNSLEGAEWLKAKLKRSWQKTMPEAKKIISEQYIIANKILDNTISKF